MNEAAGEKPAEAPPKAPPVLMLQLPKVAAAALVVSQIPWAVAIVGQFREDQAPLAAWNLLVLLWCVAAAVLLWRRFAPIFPIALVTAWYVGILSVVFALTFEIPFFWFALGAAGVAIVAVTKAREGLPGVKPARPAAPEGETFAQWAKENVEAIVVAFIMALVIRCFCIEVFKIPSSSMEPTLLGDVTSEHSPGDRENETNCPAWFEHYSDVNADPRAGGDRIMVTKYYYSFTDIERYDVVVFKFPLNQSKNFIKRVVGLPGERLYVYEGNLFTDEGDRNRGTEEFTVARRPRRVQNSAWVEVRSSEGREFLHSTKSFEDRWTALPLSSGTLYADSTVEPGVLSTRENGGTRDVRFRFPRPRGLRWQGNDVRLAFDFEMTSSSGTVFAAIQNGYGTFTLRLSAGKDSQIQWHLPGRTSGPQMGGETFPDLELVPDRRYRLDLSVYDGMAYAYLDRERLAKIEIFTARSDLNNLYAEPAFKNLDPDHAFEFGAEGATFNVRNLRVSRDFFYALNDRSTFSEDEPVKIDDHHYMMMGDNVGNSHDSRMWKETVFTLQDDITISAEGQEISRGGHADLMERFGLEREPDIHIKADQYGREWALYRAENPPADADARRRVVGVLKPGKEGEAPDKEYPLVNRKFIVGKAFWIWWPAGRWFTLIR